jgi:hypothetical protein
MMIAVLTTLLVADLYNSKFSWGSGATRVGEVVRYFFKSSKASCAISGEGLPQNWMTLLGHRRLQYIGEESLGVASG